jgi:hypothetical protein
LGDQQDFDTKILNAKLGIIKQLGFRIVEVGGVHNLLLLSTDGQSMMPKPFPEFWGALVAAWDEVLVRYDLYIDKGGSVHRKLFDGRSAVSGRAVLVVEQIWPYDKEVLVFEPPSDLASLRLMAAELEAERNAETANVAP